MYVCECALCIWMHAYVYMYVMTQQWCRAACPFECRHTRTYIIVHCCASDIGRLFQLAWFVIRSYWFLLMFILSVMKFYKLLNNLVHLEDIFEYVWLYWLEMVPFLIRRLCAGHYLHVAALHTVFKANVSLNICTYNGNKKYVSRSF